MDPTTNGGIEQVYSPESVLSKRERERERERERVTGHCAVSLSTPAITSKQSQKRKCDRRLFGLLVILHAVGNGEFAG